MMPAASFAMFFSQVQKTMGATERIEQILKTAVFGFASKETFFRIGRCAT
jgi:hypothetical protein